MSGGSYNYLYRQDAPDREHLQAMAQRLDNLGYTLLAQATRDKIVAHDDPLRQAWRAVEWLDSHDWSVRQTVREIEDAEGLYRALRDTGDQDT